ncbi:hypothetical protein C8Q80DRAFT_1221910 [Daedaleopsis nitida]|nr:hypothetical protein C8Q80DRAFT_1221910 [Daedaleopsis nitida]
MASTEIAVPVAQQPPLHTFGQQKIPGTEAYAFWQAQTGIQDEEELKKHILKVQAEAYDVRSTSRFNIPGIQGYDQVLKLGKERANAILLDVGCCFGTDTRKVAADGWPAKNLVATDLYKELWDLGHKLFCSSHETFPATFIPGDILDPEHLAAAEPLYPATAGQRSPRPAIATARSLNELRGHVAPGSMIVGTHAGATEKGVKVITRGLNGSTLSLFCHTAETWAELWDGQVFEKGTVRVEVELREVPLPGQCAAKYQYLSWSVVRL